MQRKFAIVGHRAQSSGKLNLNDLPGSGGRIDVLARAINSALFRSHGIRDDTIIMLHLLGGPGPCRRVCFDGRYVRGVRPDERAISGYIAKALKEPVPAIGHIVELQTGLWHSGGGLEQTLHEWSKEGTRIFVLDAGGELLDPQICDDDSIGFVLSDDLPFNEDDLLIMQKFFVKFL